MDKITKDLVAVYPGYGPFILTRGSTTYTFWHSLVDSSTTIGSNVAALTYVYGIPPISTAGPCDSVDFIYRYCFKSKTVIDGTLTGCVVTQLSATAVTSAYVTLTKILFNLWKIDANGVATDIIPATSIWTGTETLYGTGTGTTVTRNVGCFFSFDLGITVNPGDWLGITILTEGMRSISSTNLGIKILMDKSAGDISISIPFVEDP